MEDKKSYNKYLNTKKRKFVGMVGLLLAPLLVFSLLRFSVTGSVIRDSVGVEPYWWGWVALGVFIVIGIFMWSSHLLKRSTESRLRRHEKDVVRRVRGRRDLGNFLSGGSWRGLGMVR